MISLNSYCQAEVVTLKMPLKAPIKEKKDAKQQKMINYKLIISAANKYYSSAGHHEEKKKAHLAN